MVAASLIDIAAFLVVGAAGFEGRHLRGDLLHPGLDVLVLPGGLPRVVVTYFLLKLVHQLHDLLHGPVLHLGLLLQDVPEISELTAPADSSAWKVPIRLGNCLVILMEGQKVFVRLQIE